MPIGEASIRITDEEHLSRCQDLIEYVKTELTGAEIHTVGTFIEDQMMIKSEAELCGFRHSDTVAVTDDGIEVLTYYPRDLESLTLPI